MVGEGHALGVMGIVRDLVVLQLYDFTTLQTRNQKLQTFLIFEE